MSLTHILNTIKSQTEEEINHIKKDAEEEKQDIIKEAQIKADKIREKVKADFEKKTQEKINKAQRSADMQIKNKILLRKKEILNDVSARAAFKLGRQEDKLKILYDKLIAELGSDNSGEILASDSIAQLVKKLTDKFTIKTELKEDGFKFIGATVEIDNTLSRLINDVRDEAEIEAARILFG
ncbi:MAG: hypothetical protein ABH896_04995 [Candidatus Jacksonbacteria bacterium]